MKDEKFDPSRMRLLFNLKHDDDSFELSDGFIIGLIERAEKDGVLPAVFYGDSKYTKDMFVSKIKNDYRNNLLFAVLYKGAVAGWGLLDNMRWDHAGFHFCIFSEYWGSSLAVEGSREIYRILLNRYSVLIGVVPVDNVFAIEFCRKLGLKEIGTIPKYFYNDRAKSHIDGVQFVAARED